jgi:transcription elongation GreA/GreB family factor
MTFRRQILQHYQQLVNDKISSLQNMITALTEDAKNDAKGSAGDKHETALSMMHIEQEKLNQKIKEILLQKTILDTIDVSKTTSKIIVGSLVQANGLLFFLSTALPQITINEKTIIAVSPQSPLGSKLMGGELGFSFEINGTVYLVEAINS